VFVEVPVAGVGVPAVLLLAGVVAGVVVVVVVVVVGIAAPST
jgi:hypothetical protein